MTLVALDGPAPTLNLYREAPNADARLLFLAGRAASPLPDGRTAWPDTDGGRVVLFADGGRVDGILQGSAPDGTRLQQPTFASAAGNGILAVEPDGGAMTFRGGSAVAWQDPGTTGARGAGLPDLGASARAVFDIPMQLLPPSAPLFWIHPAEADPIPVGSAWRGRVPLLDGLYSSGWVSVDRDRTVLFASATRPEIHGYGAAGALRWIYRWTPRREVAEPRFRLSDGSLAADFTLVHQGMAVGPDGLVYVLSPEEGDAPGEAALLVLDPDGTGLVRRGSVPADAAVYVGRRGHVWVASPEDALSRTGEAERADFPAFALPDLEGGDEIRLEDHRGKVVVVNFWASWCVPCQQEMPLLDDFAGRLPAERAVVLGVNEDVNPADGRAFIQELGGIRYRSAQGGGDQQRRYQYRGLPYTVVLDPQGRVVRTFYGFGSTLAPVEEVVFSELARLEEGSGTGG
ncbi:MAG: TlpA disulfide reductase family protein [Longimicrobiales bacterium]|nr:TlpA disulfide reductase family protein [Longimicrobiales bacterium]